MTSIIKYIYTQDFLKKKIVFTCIGTYSIFKYLHNLYRSHPCECSTNTTATSATTVNPTRNNGNNGNSGITTPMIMMAAATSSGGNNGATATAGQLSSSVTGCTCATVPSIGSGGVGNNGANIGSNTFNININSGIYNDDSQANNAETLLSSNAKFQAISAIAVSQDGVINVADQGK